MKYREFNDGIIKWERIYESYDEVKDKNLPQWFKEYLLHIGEKYKTILGDIFTLIGMSETNEDYYFITSDLKGNKSFISCVGKIIPIK